MADITALKGRRNVYLRAMATIEAKVTDLTNSFDVTSEANVLELTTLRENYDKKLAEVIKLDDKIVESITVQDDAEKELGDVLVRTDSNTAVITKANFYLKKASQPPPSTHSKVKEEESARSDSSSKNENPSIKLPKMVLEKFDGKVQNWRSFWNRFETSIDNKDYLNEVDKFNYLLGLLSDDAKECVSGLDLTDENYEEAKRILNDRFGNPQVVIAAHMESLVNLPAVTSLSNVSQLRKMYDQVEVSIRNLKSLNMPPASYGALLIPVLNEKIPEELRVIISREFKDNLWNLEDMIEVVKAELHARERCSTVTLNGGRKKKGDSPGSTTENFFMESKGLCVYCRKSHSHSKCTKVTSLKARLNILRRQGRCYKCLKKGHITPDCPNTSYICIKCSTDGHHVSLCPGPRTEVPGGGTPEPVNTDNAGVETNVTFTDSHNDVLLQTAVGEVAAVGKEKFRTARLLFDNCSKRTYIIDRLRKQLDLKKIRTENLIVHTFGDKSERRQHDVVAMTVRPKGSKEGIYVEAVSVPVICSRLKNEPIDVAAAKREHEHLRNLPLVANDGTSEFEVEIMVGMDFYYSMIENDVRKGPRGPTAVKSVFGWILCGRYDACRDSGAHTVNHFTSSTHCLMTVESPPPADEIEEEDDKLKKLITNFHEVENLGINDEENIMTEFEKDLRFTGTRYSSKLLIKKHHEFIPDNYTTAFNRLKSLDKRMRNDPKLYQDYDDVIRDYISQGIVEIVDDAEEVEAGSVHYLPHRPVIKEDRQTTKVRPVFDASSRANKEEPSLSVATYF